MERITGVVTDPSETTSTSGELVACAGVGATKDAKIMEINAVNLNGERME